MSEISVTEAAFVGLKALRQRPATLLVWYLAMVALTLGLMAAFAALAGSAVAEMQALQGTDPSQADPQALLAATGKMMGGFLMMIPAYLVFAAITTAAANRMILRPQESGLGYLRLGADEFRLIVVMLVIGLICGALYLVGATVASLVAAVSSGAMSGEVPDQAKMMPVLLLTLAPVILLEVFLLLKFALAPAQTMDTKAISIFGSWGLTKGHLGKVFLTYLLAAVVYCVIYAVGLGIAMGVWMAMGSDKGLMGILQPDMTSVAAVLAAPMIVYFLIMGLVSALGLALLASPAASLYQQITGRGEDQPEE